MGYPDKIKKIDDRISEINSEIALLTNGLQIEKNILQSKKKKLIDEFKSVCAHPLEHVEIDNGYYQSYCSANDDIPGFNRKPTRRCQLCGESEIGKITSSQYVGDYIITYTKILPNLVVISTGYPLGLSAREYDISKNKDIDEYVKRRIKS